MQRHAQPTTETFQDVYYQANEPTRLLLHLLYKAGDTDVELSVVASLFEALQEVANSRIDAAFHAIDEQIGVIKLDDMPMPDSFFRGPTRVTATLEPPRKIKEQSDK